MHFLHHAPFFPALGRFSLLQGPSNGSPFVDAPLPFDALKAPPDSAFEILMICLGVALLAALVTAAFLAVGKLGSLQEQLRKEFALRKKAAGADGQSPGGVGDGAVLDGSALLASLDQLRASIEAGNERMEERLGSIRVALEVPAGRVDSLRAGIVRSDADSPLDGVDPSGDGGASASSLETMKGLTSALVSFHGAAEAQSNRLAGQVEALAQAIAHMPQGPMPQRLGPGATTSPLPSSSGGGPFRPATAASAIQATRANLSAQGYTQIEVITPPSDIDAARLKSGELLVEAKRGGAVFKGRVLLDDGQVVDAQLRPSHKIFP